MRYFFLESIFICNTTLHALLPGQRRKAREMDHLDYKKILLIFWNDMSMTGLDIHPMTRLLAWMSGVYLVDKPQNRDKSIYRWCCASEFEDSIEVVIVWLDLNTLEVTWCTLTRGVAERRRVNLMAVVTFQGCWKKDGITWCQTWTQGVMFIERQKIQKFKLGLVKLIGYFVFGMSDIFMVS